VVPGRPITCVRKPRVDFQGAPSVIWGRGEKKKKPLPQVAAFNQWSSFDLGPGGMGGGCASGLKAVRRYSSCVAVARLLVRRCSGGEGEGAGRAPRPTTSLRGVEELGKAGRGHPCDGDDRFVGRFVL